MFLICSRVNKETFDLWIFITQHVLLAKKWPPWRKKVLMTIGFRWLASNWIRATNMSEHDLASKSVLMIFTTSSNVNSSQGHPLFAFCFELTCVIIFIDGNSGHNTYSKYFTQCLLIYNLIKNSFMIHFNSSHIK